MDAVNRATAYIVGFARARNVRTRDFDRVKGFELPFWELVAHQLCHLLVYRSNNVGSFNDDGRPEVNFVFELPLHVQNEAVATAYDRVVLRLNVDYAGLVNLVAGLTFAGGDFDPLPWFVSLTFAVLVHCFLVGKIG